MFGLNNTQVKALAERLAQAIIAGLVTGGYVDSADAGIYVSMVIAIIGGAYALYENRQRRILEKAAKVPGTTVVASPENAARVKSGAVLSSEIAEVIARTKD